IQESPIPVWDARLFHSRGNPSPLEPLAKSLFPGIKTESDAVRIRIGARTSLNFASASLVNDVRKIQSDYLDPDQLRRTACPLIAIGIGGSLAAPPLPHHRAYGSVHGGSVDYAAGAPAREARRRVLRKSSFESAMASAGLLLIRQGP